MAKATRTNKQSRNQPVEEVVASDPDGTPIASDWIEPERIREVESWPEFDYGGKTAEQEVQGQAVIIGYMFAAVAVALAVGVALVLWLS